MKQEFYDAVSGNPIIAAIRDKEGLKACLDMPDLCVVFVLYGSVDTVEEIVARIHQMGKMVFVHMDMITGLSGKEDAVSFIAKYTKADGIISTRMEQIRRAKELDLSTVYRVFMLDSKVLHNISANHHIKEYADVVEILPGQMPKIIHLLHRQLPVPVVAGGLIAEKEDVLAALDAGAIAISSTNQEVWNM